MYASATCGFARWPILVATVSASSQSFRNRPISCSLRPSPYTSAAPRKVTPASTAGVQQGECVGFADVAPIRTELPATQADHRDLPVGASKR